MLLESEIFLQNSINKLINPPQNQKLPFFNYLL